MLGRAILPRWDRHARDKVSLSFYATQGNYKQSSILSNPSTPILTLHLLYLFRFDHILSLVLVQQDQVNSPSLDGKFAT